MHNSTLQWVDAYLAEAEAVAHDIFTFAELAGEETRSARCLIEYLEHHGFTIQSPIGGMPTAFKAEWGSGAPSIGFLGEYDALPGLDQNAVPYREGDDAKSGHGCGHNLFGAGAAAAAIGLRYALEHEKIAGTVVYYGCPAEEILKGKIVMADNGCFRDLDVALGWHPGTEYDVGGSSYLAMDSVHFSFFGKAAHAAGAPHMGRSALDAAELMNVGVNYLREHVPDDVRIHYSYIHGGDKPNVVPAHAKLWYFIRSRSRATVDDVTTRIIDIAKGAALMTGTRPEWEFQTRGYDTLINHTLCSLIYDVMRQVELPVYTDQERHFAGELATRVDSAEANGDIAFDILAPTGQISYTSGSTDISDVSQIVPVGYLRAVCAPTGIPLHSWQFAACSDFSIGRKGMAFAARSLAWIGLTLAKDPALLERVKGEFARTAKGYVSLNKKA
jgi:aminobenzoyl-glutamate utilization protein B